MRNTPNSGHSERPLTHKETKLALTSFVGIVGLLVVESCLVDGISGLLSAGKLAKLPAEMIRPMAGVSDDVVTLRETTKK